jgi:hypothetical protein
VKSHFYPAHGYFFGDYNNISAHDNVIRPIWTRMHNNQLSIWTAIIDDVFLGEEEYDSPAFPFALEQNSPNPFYGNTSFSFTLKQSSEITLKISDLYSREIVKLIDNEYRLPGKYTVHFDSRKYLLSPGIYYFSLSGNMVNQVRKMIIER